MRFILIFIFLFVTPFAWGCGSDPKPINIPFVEFHGKSDDLNVYEIFAPKKHGEYFITSIYLNKEGEISVSLDLSSAFGYSDYKSAFITINNRSIDDYKIIINYSTTKDGGLIMCGGNDVKTSISELLGSDKPNKIIPSPPEAPVRNK